jgi:hypothetical protein
LVAQLQIHERLVVTLALLQRVQVVQRVQVLLVQLVQVLLAQLVLAQLLVVVPLELVEHPCSPKMFGVQKNLKQQESLAYLF